MAERSERVCQECQHYRVQSSFVDTYKSFDRSPARKAIMDSLKELRQEETEALGSEVELLFELFRVEAMEWPSKPRFAPYCAAHGKTFVHGVKNRDRDCEDFGPAFSRQGRACQTCANVNAAPRRIGDRKVDLNNVSPGDDSWMHWVNLNKEKEDADAQAQGLEIEQAYYSEGRLTHADFLPTCRVQTDRGTRLTVPFVNLRMDCALHRQRIPVPPMLLAAMRKRALVPRERGALEPTIALIRSVADCHPHAPDEFLARAKHKPIEASWAADIVLTRWLAEVELPHETASRARAHAMRIKAAAPEKRLMPVIAGCDALEWGALAAMASNGIVLPVAGVIAQQLAEFLAGTLHPNDRADSAADVLEMLVHERVFGEDVFEHLEGFLLGIDALAREQAYLVKHDVRTYLQELFFSLSNACARLLEDEHGPNAQIPPEQRQQLSEIGFPLERITGLRTTTFEQAHTVCATLGEAFRIIAANEPRAPLTAALKAIIEIDDAQLRAAAQLELDIQLAALNHQAVGAVQGARPTLSHVMPMMDGVGQWAMEMALQQHMGTAQQSADQITKRANTVLENTQIALLVPKRVNATLVFARGNAPITPCALDMLGRTPAIGRIPATVQEAITEPASRTLEAMHGGRFSAPSPEGLAYMTKIRVISVPTYLESRP
jgi:hypothetical protein